MNNPAHIQPHHAAYTLLDPKRSEFRLIELQPSADFESPVECLLTKKDLNERPCYEALSYVWGEPKFTQEIQLNHEPFFITPNLELALRYIRSASEKRTIWVDAICINQNDISERSQQVRLMRDIFQYCKTDLVWLGPYPSHSDVALKQLVKGMKIMEEISSFHVTNIGIDDSKPLKEMRTDEDWKLIKTDEKRPLKGWSSRRSSDSRTEGWILSHSECWALSEMLRRSPVWHRIWIMQEVSCAPDVLLLAGNSTLSWDKVASFLADTTFADAFHAIFGHGYVKPLLTGVFGPAQVIEHQRRIMREVPNGYMSTLFDVLARFRRAKATDPRDTIYGLLGLVSEPYKLAVDYNKTAQELFTYATLWMINCSTTLDILCQGPWSGKEHQRENRMHGLPSWVPDFSTSGCDFTSSGLFAQRSIFSAGNATLKPMQAPKGILRLSGVMLGRIDRVAASPSRHVWEPEEQLPWYLTNTPLDHSLLDETKSYDATREPCLQAYWRTLVADCKCYPMQRLTKDEIANCDKIITSVMIEKQPIDALESLECRNMWERMRSDWRFAMTDNGFYALIMHHVEEGDVIAVLDGAKVPVVLRSVEKESSPNSVGTYRLVSTAYVHGFMDGEAQVWADDGGLKAQKFSIV